MMNFLLRVKSNRFKRSTYYRFMLPALLPLFIFFACEFGGERAIIPTGVEVQDQPDGSRIIIATARASVNAINQGKIAMKRTTSRDAAQLLIKNELKKPHYKNINKNYSVKKTIFLENGEYCRIQGQYKTAPPPTKKP